MIVHVDLIRLIGLGLLVAALLVAGAVSLWDRWRRSRRSR